MQPENPIPPDSTPGPQPAQPVLPAQPQVIQPTQPVQPVVSPTGMPAPAVPPNPTISPTVMPASMGPQPAQPTPSVQPAVISGQHFPPAMHAASSGSRRKTLLIILGIAVIVVIAAVLFLVVLKKPITKQEVSSTQSTASSFNTNVFDATNAINRASEADSAATVKTNIDDANGKLDDAQKQFATLKKSRVLKDKSVKQSFNALNDKWTPYLAYLRGSSSDIQALLPVVIDFVNKTEGVDTPTDSSGLSAYLTQIKQTIDSTSQQVDKLNMTLPEDKTLLEALKTNLASSSAAVAKAQSDLAAGKPAYVAEDDLLGLSEAETTFETKVDDVDSQLSAKQDKLDPANAYNKYVDSLNALLPKAKS